MKRKIGLIILLVLFLLFFARATLSAQYDKTAKIYAGLGYAFSDYEGLMGNFGLEMQATTRIFVQLGFDYYFNPLPDQEDILDTSYTLMGVNINLGYHLIHAEKFLLKIKGGLYLAGLRNSIDVEGMTLHESDTQIGVLAGINTEYSLNRFNKKLALLLGGDIHFIFDKRGAQWFKVYTGISYRLK